MIIFNNNNNNSNKNTSDLYKESSFTHLRSKEQEAEKTLRLSLSENNQEFLKNLGFRLKHLKK